MIVQISGQLEIDLDDPSGSDSIRNSFEEAIEQAALEWGLINDNFVEVRVISQDEDPQPEDEDV